MALLASIFLCFPASAQDGAFTEEVVRADFEYLYKTLQSAHFNLYAHRSREDYDRYYQQVLGSIDGPKSQLEVVRRFAPFVAYGQVGHAKIDFPVPDYVAYLQAGGTLLPLDIRVENGRVFITNSYSEVTGLAPGAELISVNGRPASDWITSASRYVSAERPYMANAQLESMFPRLVWLDAGKIDSFQLTLRPEGGKDSTLKVGAVPVMVLEERKGAQESVQHSRKAELLPDGIAYLRPGPFYATKEGETAEIFEAFIDDAFGRFIAADAQDLVIDLRNNPGGDNSYSDPMIAWTADKPFRFASKYELKTSPQTLEVLHGFAAVEPGGISAQMLEAMKKHEIGEIFEFPIPIIQPREPGYSGRVWALINRHSYSNATTVAAII